MARRSSSITPDIAFDPRAGYTGRYVNRTTNRYVSQDTVNAALESQITKGRENANRIFKQLADGEISIADAQLQMRAQMKIIHTSSAALAKGGWANMSQADWGAVGGISSSEYRRLEKVMVSVADGKLKLRNLAGEPNGTLLRVADDLAQGGITTYSQMQTRTAAQNGATHERRILDSGAKHCACCVEQADLGAQPIGELKPIGNCTCSKNCRCEKEFGIVEDGAFKT